MSRLAYCAAAGAAGLSTVALFDATVVGLSGHGSVISDEFGVTGAWIVGGLVHVTAYLVLAVVLLARGPVVDGRSRLRRLVRWALMLSLLALFAFAAYSTVAGVVAGAVGLAPVPVAVVGFAGFLGSFLFSSVLGLTLLRRPLLRAAGWVMAATLPALGVTMLLGALGSPFAHPAYAETTSAVGIALLAFAPRRAEAVMQVNGAVAGDGDGRSIPVGAET